MTVWWKIANLLMSSSQAKEAGLMDAVLKREFIQPPPRIRHQLRLWIGKP